MLFQSRKRKDVQALVFSRRMIELRNELVNMTYEMGLNIQKTWENSLKEAIQQLTSFN